MKPTAFNRSNIFSKVFPCSIALSIIAAMPSAQAASGTWTGNTSVTWATSTNWSGGTVPGGTSANSDIATFNSATYLSQPTAVNNYFLGGLVFGTGNSGGASITTGTANNRLNVGSSGILMNAGTGTVTLGNVSTTQGVNVTANQSWTNNSSSLLNISRVSVDDTLTGNYTITINGSGSGGVTVSNNLSDDNNAASSTRKVAVVINSSASGATNFTNSSTYSGGTTLTAGLIQIGGASTGTVGTITSSCLGTGSLALNGGKISTSSSTSRTILNALSIGGDVILGDATNTGTLTFGANTNLGAATRTLTLASSSTFDGAVSNGGITKLGTGTLTFSGTSANTYTGLTTVSAGGLTLSKTSVNAIVGDAKIDGTGTITLGAADQIRDASTVEIAAGTLALGTFSETVNSVKLTGGAITGTTGVLTSSTAFDFQSSGSVTAILAGTAGANKTTAGTVTLTGANANTYTGLTTVSAGSLVLRRTAGANGALVDDALVNGTGTLQITNADQIANAANLEVATGGIFAMGVNAETVNSVKLSGGSITGGVAGILTSATAFDLQSGSASAVLAGSVGANKTTEGTVSLTGSNTYTGATAVTTGTLVVNGNIATSSLTTVQSGATLGGSGTIGNLAIGTGGFFSPGNSPGIMTVSGNYSQNGQLNVEIEGPAAGNGTGFHDQVVVNGTVSLTGALNIASFNGFTPVNGNLIFILLNDGTDAVSGSFAGLSQGAVVSNYGGFDWQISYVADGDSLSSPSFSGGNDIALMAIPEPSVTTLFLGLGTCILFLRRRA